MNVTYRKSKSRSEISRKVVRICFPGVFASCLVVTLTYAEMSTEKSRFLTDKATDKATDTEARLTPSGKGATGTDEAER